MYEINLVPEVKAELITKQKIRNLVWLVCIVVMIACGAVLLMLGGIAGTQAAEILAKDNEIKCRSDGSGNCDGMGTAVYKFENLEELLTMQNQMKTIKTVGQNRIALYRLFPMMDTIRYTGNSTLYIEKASVDFESKEVYLEMHSYDSQGFTLQESFRKGTPKTYFDYGSYMRLDAESEEYVKIPSFCIAEEKSDERGLIYGLYTKGAPGCEAPMITRSNEKDESESEEAEESSEEEKTDEGETETEEEESKIEYIWVRRSYDDREDKENYKLGKDKYVKETEEKNKGYYFESSCIQYDSEGKFDEDATLEACAVVDGDVEVHEGQFGDDDQGRKVLTFKANFTFNNKLFLASNKHVMIIGPSRRNVTDSYVQVQPIFDEKAEVVKDEEK